MRAASGAILAVGVSAVALLAGCGGSGKDATATPPAMVDVRDVIADTKPYNGKVVESVVNATTGVIGDFYSTKPGRQEAPLVLAMTSRQGQHLKDLVRQYGKSQELLIRYKVHMDSRTHGVLVSVDAHNLKAPPVRSAAPKGGEAAPPMKGVDDEADANEAAKTE